MMPKLMEVLEYLDDTGNVMVARMPQEGPCEIKWGAQLTVRESQSAVFFRDGKSVGVFKRPGRYVLKTQNIPALTKFVTKFGYGPDSPFRSEVYFLNMKLFRNLKWGTSEPIIFRDPELQMIRLRSYGIFSIQIKNPIVFLNKIVGTQGVFTDAEIKDYLKNIIITRLIDILGTQVKSVFELPKVYDELSTGTKAVLEEDFEALGLFIVDFFINSISPPEEVQKIIDERTSMQVIGDMNKYIQFKTAKSLEMAANNPGGPASAGVGMGAGLGMGMMLPQIVQQSFNSQQPATNPSKSVEITESDHKSDPISKLKELKALLDSDIINKDEFESKKIELLKQI
ncbi:Putative virion core protein (lumpy skin disease virus) [Limihaloglobus sulfuriphilus]|uniref:Putative virion core protein (Lumpy skin disease virus) n=1 Tax=Limihaloglobus sulfuriphilus TaxID=1851148 RepID=A0A1Q2MF91_9BACT|nr:SPFH domain-containing protein [Limihaloglobus sulfuriphilus]AQQ71375.1 Putative virion core protein (lumpy skin disease virus) [Limihaloglobus sulfuriphilus]